MAIPLTKTLQLSDLEALDREVALVDRFFDSAQRQNHMRRWEYAMAIRALKSWGEVSSKPMGDAVTYDIGGAGSPFRQMIGERFSKCSLIDPDGDAWKHRLDEFITMNPPLGDAVFCLSVIEHVDNLPRFLYHLGCLVAPGGLLFLTMDCRENVEGDIKWPPADVDDDRHFHWMRKRIFTPRHIEAIHPFTLGALGFGYFGGADFTYHGHTVNGGYSFASLALRRRP